MDNSTAESPRRGGRPSKVRAWAMVVVLLGSTALLFVAGGLRPHEWACEVTFIAAHLLAGEVILAARRDD